MNRTDRLLAIVIELQGKGTQRAEDLAATFEVSKRTIYRDIQAVSEAGVPIIASPGRGYALVEGYFLPPLSFTSNEAIHLLLGSDVMAGSFDAEYRAAAQSAGRKIAGVLPERLRADVQALRESIHFIAEERAGASPTAELLAQLRRSIIKRQTVRCDYTAHQGTIGTESNREADPYALVHVGGAWYLVAYCRLRQSVGRFRLERIERLVLLDRTFERPPGFRAQQ
jgi:predicted DNA-binding transcriptional regulator YafY